MTYPITPKPTIHELTPAQKQKQNLAMSQQVEAMAKQMVGGIVNAILQILTGGTLGGDGTHNGIDLFGNLFNNLFKTLGITDPAGILAQIEQDLFDVEQVLTHWVDNILSPLKLVLDGKTWQGFIDGILGGFENGVEDLADSLKTSIEQAQKAVGQIVQMVASAGQQEFAGLLQQLSTMLTSISSLGGSNLIGAIPTDVLHVLDLGSVNQTLQELTGNGAFLSSNSIDVQANNAGIFWDGTVSHNAATPGSARFDCSGATKSLFSNPISVTEGQQLSLSTWVRWQSLSIQTGTSTPIELNVATFKDGALLGYTNIGKAGSVGSSTTWGQISGIYTVPAGVDRVMMKLTVQSNAVGGKVWFDEASMTRTGLLAGDWMSGIKDTVAKDFQSIVDQIYQAIKGTAPTGTQDLTTILTNFQSAWNKLFGDNYVKDALWGLVIPNLAPSKLDPSLGQLAEALIPDITQAMSSGIQAAVDALVNAVNNGSSVNNAVGAAKDALQKAWAAIIAGLSGQPLSQLTDWASSRTTFGYSDVLAYGNKTNAAISTLAASLASLQNAANQTNNGGNSLYTDFANLGNADYWNVTYSGGSGRLAVSGTQATWSAVNNSPVSGVGIYQPMMTATDYQKVSIAFASSPVADQVGNTAYNYIIGRANHSGTDYVFAKFSSTQFWIGYSIGGVETIMLGPKPHSFVPGASYTLECGTSLGPNTYRVSCNGVPIPDGTVTSASYLSYPNAGATVTLLHGDGLNGSTTITDSAATPLTWNVSGAAKLSTASSKFGSASLAFDGTASTYAYASNAGFAFGYGDFTIEGWVNITSGTNKVVFQQGTSLFGGTSNSVALVYNPTGYGTWRIYANNTYRDSSATYTAGTWNHVALVRYNSTTTLYVNGVAVISMDDANYYSGTYFGIGNGMVGYVDELRVLSGVAAYTRGFSPPLQPFTNETGQPGHRYAGFKVYAWSTNNYYFVVGPFQWTDPPGAMAAFALSDNTPQKVLGSAFRAHSTNTTSFGFSASGYAIGSYFNGLMAGKWYDSLDYCTSDLTWDSSTSTIKVSQAGWYSVHISQYMSSSTGTNSTTVSTALFKNGVLNQVGPTVTGSGVTTSSFMVFCNANDTLTPGFYGSSISTSGNAYGYYDGTGSYNWWSVNYLNRSTAS